MGNYIPRWRTNHFKVKDKVEFLSWVDSFYSDYEVVMNTVDDAEWFAIYSTGETGEPSTRSQTPAEAEDWLTNHPDMLDPGLSDDDNIRRVQEEDEMEMDFYLELSEHLTDDCVACGVEVGYEGMRYLIGTAVVVDSTGERSWVGLTQWIDAEAKKLFPGKTCTDPSY